MKKKAIFFDVGETLVYRNPSLLKITARFLKNGGINVRIKILDKVLKQCALKMKPIVEKGIVSDSKKWEIYMTMVFEKLHIKNKRLMIDLMLHLRKGTSFRLFPDARKVLKHLRNKGFKLGVISNAAPEVENILKRVGIYNFFDSITISENVGYEKPDVNIFRIALKTLRVKSGEAIYVGDNFVADVKGAIKAGITPVWLRRKSKNNEFSYSGKASKNILKIRNLTELLKFLTKGV